MDHDAPMIVLKGFFATCSAGAVVGGAYAIAKRQSPIISVVNSSINSGITGLTFFALREYVVGPALVHTVPWQTYVRRRATLGPDSSSPSSSLSGTRISSSEMRSQKVLDTALAGAATGGILNGWKRGPPGVLPGIVTVGAICTVAQLIWNELNMTRVKYISRVNPTRVSGLTEHVAVARQRTFSEKLMDGLGLVFPVKKIPDDVYLQKLLREKDDVERRLKVVRKELENVDTYEKE